MRQFEVRTCPIAVREHQRSCRQYAHVFHRKNVICVTKAFFKLPQQTRLALLLHEVGHLLVGDRPSEDAANRAVKRYSGVTIWYKDQPQGENLEWIRREDIQKAKKALGLLSANGGNDK